jgi:hypothetical protein
MAFFVEETPQSQFPQRKEQNNVNFEDLEISILATAKKAGLSFMELNELRVCDYIKFMEIYTGEGENKPRRATQDDIDRLLG